MSDVVHIYSDGGFSLGFWGAFGVQLLVYTGTTREHAGFQYHYDEQAKNGFEMELRGLDAATNLLLRACGGIPKQPDQGRFLETNRL